MSQAWRVEPLRGAGYRRQLTWRTFITSTMPTSAEASERLRRSAFGAKAAGRAESRGDDRHCGRAEKTAAAMVDFPGHVISP